MWLSSLICLILVLIILWLWQSNMKSKELALEAVKNLCEKNKVELLDQTVSLRQFKLKRLIDGRMAFLRIYEFDYGKNGLTQDRYRGRVITHGNEILDISLKFQDGLSVLNRAHLNLTPSRKDSNQAKIVEFEAFKKIKELKNTPPSNDPQKS